MIDFDYSVSSTPLALYQASSMNSYIWNDRRGAAGRRLDNRHCAGCSRPAVFPSRSRCQRSGRTREASHPYLQTVIPSYPYAWRNNFDWVMNNTNFN